MPKRKMNRTMRARGKSRRDAAVRSMASSSMQGATSLANSTFKRPMRRGRKSRLKKDKYLIKGVKSLAKSLGSVGKMAYDTSMPMIKEASRSVGKSFSKTISEKRVPRVPNNATWVNLKDGLEEGLINLGLLDDGEEINPAIYFQSVERFLDDHKNMKITRDNIKRVERSFRGMPGMPGDPTPVIMKRYFQHGITHENLIAAFNHGFQDILVDNLDMDIPSRSTPGSGFQAAKFTTARKQKMAKIVNLSRGIEILLGTDDKLGHYKSTIKENFDKLNDLVTTDEELKVLQELVKKYPQLNSMMPAALKKKAKGKKGSHKKKGKRTKQRDRTSRR